MERKYYRSASDCKIAGVCGGLAQYFDIDPLIVRLGFVALLFISAGMGIVLYVLLAILAPKA